MTTNNSTAKRLAVIAIGSLFLWACSDTPKPTASGSGETQEKALASEGGDTIPMGTGGIAEMHAAMAQDSLHMGGTMMMGKDPGEAMALPSNGTGVGSQETPPAPQAEAPTGDAHGH